MKTNKKFKYQDEIDNWAIKKSKLKTIEELTILKKYLIYNSYMETELRLSSDYIFNYYPNNLLEIKKLKLRPENVFKLSIVQILNKFKEYFENVIDFEILFEKPNEVEAENECKKINNCAKPDIQIYISKTNLDDKKLFIIEYNEKKSHEDVYDSYKDIKSIQHSYVFYKYEEKNEHIDCSNFTNTIKNIIMDMFCVICTLLNDRFILSKIIFFESFSHIEKDELEIKTNIFNYIGEVSKNKIFDLKKLYLELRPYNSEGEPYTWNEFIKLLKSEYKIDLGSDIKQINFESKHFSMIIICLNSNICETIREYKKIYLESIKALDKASEKIIYFTNKQFEKMQISKKYLENYLEHDLEKNKDIGKIKRISTKLNNKLAKY